MSSEASAVAKAADLPFQAVFSDIDGTLVDANHHPMPQTAPTVQRLTQMGVPFVLVSSRATGGITCIHRQLGFHGPYVAYGGALIRDEDGHDLYSKTIDIDSACQIKDYLTSQLPQVFACTYGFDTWIVDTREDPRVKQEEFFIQDQAVESSDVRGTFGQRGVHKFMLMGEPDAILQAEREVKKRFPQLAVVRSRAELCEISAGGVRKSEGVRMMCQHLGVDPARCLAFGDGLNDLDMMGAVGTSYAMANAEPQVKEAATHVARWSNVQNGVGRTLEELLQGR
ncbi:MAG: Cof-type HAD-IIB family hydrolase [Atopobiaceae bacterium]